MEIAALKGRLRRALPPRALSVLRRLRQRVFPSMLDRMMKEAQLRETEAREAAYAQMSSEQVFNQIYHRNHWGSLESVSGPGSELATTAEVRQGLSTLLTDLSIKSMLDAPCGDFNWI